MKTTGKINLALLATVLVFSSTAVAHTVKKQWPHVGSAYYDGQAYADVLFWSHDDYIPVQTNTFFSKPGLEIDLSLTDKNFFKSCTSWSNMPNFYDDCVTAGVSEYGTGTSFGIGTYDLRDLDPDTTYFGGWSFTLGTATTSEVKISWQEVWKDFCPFANPWCMNSVDGGRFLTSQFEKGQSKIVNWYY